MGTRFSRGSALAAAALLLLGGAALAQSHRAGKAGSHAVKRSSQDRNFVMDAARGGMAEVTLGKLAASKGTTADVRQFGQHMVDDHSRANADLKQTVSGKGIMLPKSMGAEHQALYNRLSRLSGAAFDRTYTKEMVADHRKDVAEFRKEARTGHDAAIRQFASRTLPTLQHHMQMAVAAAQQVGTMRAHRSPKAPGAHHAGQPAGAHR